MLKADDKFYFFHIPKTAGTSLNAWLSTKFSPSDVCPCFAVAQLHAMGREKLGQYRFFAGHFGLELLPFLARPPQMITWLRAPARRLLSSYHYLREMKPGVIATLADPYSQNQQEAACRLSFDDWVRLPEEGYHIHNLTAQMMVGPSIWGDNVLPVAMRVMESFVHVGLVERMQDSVDLLSYRLGWRPQGFDFHINGSRASDYAGISPDTMMLIRERSHRDYAIYDWAVRRFEQRWHEMLLALAGLSPGKVVPQEPDRKWIHRAMERRCAASGASAGSPGLADFPPLAGAIEECG